MNYENYIFKISEEGKVWNFFKSEWWAMKNFYTFVLATRHETWWIEEIGEAQGENFYSFAPTSQHEDDEAKNTEDGKPKNISNAYTLATQHEDN